MKKKIAIFMVLAALVAVPVFAATTDQVQTPFQCPTNMIERHNQMIQQAVDKGTITSEEAALVKDEMQKMAPIMQKMRPQDGTMRGMGMGMMQKGNMMNHQQMVDNCNQRIQQALDNGTITTEEATQIKDHIKLMAPIMEKMMANGGMMMHKGNMMGHGRMMNNANNNNK